MADNGGKTPNGVSRRPGSMHPQTRLGYNILPYLRELDDHEWTAEEQAFLEWSERARGRPLTEPEKRLWVAQTRMIGDLRAGHSRMLSL